MQTYTLENGDKWEFSSGGNIVVHHVEDSGRIGNLMITRNDLMELLDASLGKGHLAMESKT